MPRVELPGRILIVDDEHAVLVALEAALSKVGHSVVAASSGEEALDLLDDSIEVIITDQNMPGLLGIDFLKIARVRKPRAVRIMLTGDADPETPVRSINEGEVYRFLRKPWNNADLRTVVAFALDVARLKEDKRHLIRLLRKQMESPDDPADIESEIERLAEEEVSA